MNESEDFFPHFIQTDKTVELLKLLQPRKLIKTMDKAIVLPALEESCIRFIDNKYQIHNSWFIDRYVKGKTKPAYLKIAVLKFLKCFLLLFRQRRCQCFIVTDNEPVCGIVLTAFDNRDFMRDDVPVVKFFQSGHCVHLAFSARHNTTDREKSPEEFSHRRTGYGYGGGNIFIIRSDNNLRSAAACAVFFDDDLFVDFLLQLGNVRDDADQAVALA